MQATESPCEPLSTPSYPNPNPNPFPLPSLAHRAQGSQQGPPPPLAGLPPVPLSPQAGWAAGPNGFPPAAATAAAAAVFLGALQQSSSHSLTQQPPGATKAVSSATPPNMGGRTQAAGSTPSCADMAGPAGAAIAAQLLQRSVPAGPAPPMQAAAPPGSEVGSLNPMPPPAGCCTSVGDAACCGGGCGPEPSGSMRSPFDPACLMAGGCAPRGALGGPLGPLVPPQGQQQMMVGHVAAGQAGCWVGPDQASSAGWLAS